MVVKFMARDCELSTTGIDAHGHSIDPWKVTRDVLGKIDAVFQSIQGCTWSYARSSPGGKSSASPYAMDCLRHWGSNGQCYYADMCHVEACTASTFRPRQFAAQSVSALLVAEEARKLAEQEADEGVCYSLAATNADAADPAISWGTHLNVSVGTELWEDLFVHHTHPGMLGYVASAMAAAIPFFGTGYLLPLKDGSTNYSLSARAHHLSRVHTLTTTEPFGRGLLNTRREPHGKDQERLHLIGFDYSIAGAALLCSFVQCLLAAAEEGYCGMILLDPVRSLRHWSWCLDLETGLLPATAALIDGRSLTLPEFVRELAQRLLEMCEGGLISEELAPDATEMLPRVIELTHYAQEGSIDRCARHLDWAAKLMCLVGSELELGSAQARLMDHDFANTDRRRGTLWRLWDEELIDPLITLGDAEVCLVDGPQESRAWGRGQLIQRFAGDISAVDWSYVELRKDSYRWGPRLRVEMPHLDSFNRQKFEPIIREARSVDDLERLLNHQSRLLPLRRSDPVLDTTSQLATYPERDEDRQN